MNPYILIATLLAGSAVGVLGYQATVIPACANSISNDKTGMCPKAIQTAFDAAKLKLAKTEIEYRDRVITVMAQDSNQDRERAYVVQGQVDALNQEEKTNACASSPAMQLRRQQLCNTVGGPADCPK